MNLTKKDIFLTKLKGDRIILTAKGHEDWYELLVLACETSILKRINRAKKDRQIRMYKINYPITLNDLSNAGFVRTANSRFVGECIVFHYCNDAMGDEDCF